MYHVIFAYHQKQPLYEGTKLDAFKCSGKVILFALVFAEVRHLCSVFTHISHVYTLPAAPPLLKRTSSDMDVVQGNAVNLVCHATGSPQPIVSWTRSKGNTNKRNPISLPTSNASQMLLFQGRLAFFNLQSQAPGCSPSRTELCASRMLHQRTRGNIPARRITALGTQAIRCSCTSAVRVVADITLLNNT